MALLSVIIPVYNSTSTLERCVGSVLSQDISGMEIILVDDGSWDGSSELCDSIAASNDCISVIHRKNGGLSAARNTGIAASKGEWLTFVDSDDELAPGTLSDNMEWAGSHPLTDLVEFPVTVHACSPAAYDIDFLPETIQTPHIFSHWVESEGYRHCYACNKLFRRRLFQKISFPEGESFEDAAVCPAIVRECREIHYSDKGRYIYYKSADSITINYRFHNQEPLFRHNFRLLEEISAQGFSPRARTRLWNVSLNLLIDLCRCRDADRAYITRHFPRMRTLRPSISHILKSGLPLLSVIKSLLSAVIGVKGVCLMFGMKKHRS